MISSPSTGSGTPITAASATAGCSRRTFSAATADHVALAVDEGEPAFGVEAAEVAGEEPPVAQRRPRRLGVAEVRGHARRRAHRDLAHRPRGERPARVVDDRDLDAGHGPPA